MLVTFSQSSDLGPSLFRDACFLRFQHLGLLSAPLTVSILTLFWALKVPRARALCLQLSPLPAWHHLPQLSHSLAASRVSPLHRTSHPLHRTSLPSHRPGIPTNSWKAPSLLLAFIQQMVICNYEHFIGHTVVFLVFPELSPAARTQDTQDHPPAFMTSVYLDGSTTFPLSRLKVTPTPLSSSHINNRQILWI